METDPRLTARDLWRYGMIATSFLTCIPVPDHSYRSGDLSRAASFFPVVGALIGVLNFGLFRMLRTMGVGSWLTALLVVTMGLILTRGLHLDGWADICDGLFATKDVEKRREILKDSHLGSFGVVGIVLLLGFKTIAIGENLNPYLLMVAPVAGRTAALVIGGYFHPFVREKSGLGEEFLGRVSRWSAWMWMVAVMIFPLGVGGIYYPIQAGAGFIMGWLFGKILERSFHGLSGDGIGATIEVIETLFLYLGRQ